MAPLVGRTTQTWKRLRIKCFNRDKAVRAKCWLCHGDIDYNAKPSSTDDSWEPDHRFTVHDHPELAELPENIMPSHRKCNRSRKDRAGLDELGNCSRVW